MTETNQPIGLLVLGLVLGLMVTYAAQNSNLIPYVVVLGMLLILFLFRDPVKEMLLCGRCLGNGRILCSNTFCQKGLIHATPRYASSSFIEPFKKKQNSYVYEVNNVHIASNGFPGSFRIVANVFSKGLNELLGQYKSDEIFVNTLEIVIPSIQVPLELDKINLLEQGFQRQITASDLGIDLKVENITKGYACPTCNMTSLVVCPLCKGKRFKLFIK